MATLKERLNELLIKKKLITQEQITKALDIQAKKGGKLSDIIVAQKFVKEKDLTSVLSEGLGFPLIDLKRFKIDPEVAKIIPADVARHYQIILISKIADTITVAMADPLNIFAIDHIEALTGYKINPIISYSHDILLTIDASYPDATGGIIDNLVKEISVSSIEFISEKAEALPSTQELSLLVQEAPIIKITNAILEEAVKLKASDILIEPLDKKLRVRFRVDGILQERAAPPKNMHAPIISRIKVMSDLDIAEHRLPQDGRFKTKINGKEVDFRVSVLPSSFGENISIRILDKSVSVLDIEKLGFSKDTIAKLKKVSSQPHGMILVCGPTGSGKTTTLYSILNFVNSPEKNIVTVEDPIEFQLEGINQVNARPQVGLTFAASLRSILRQDPNVIMIGEIRDYETVDIAIKSALTGHLVLSTLHTTSSAGAVTRLINMGVEAYLLNSALLCVVAQRLLRRICPYCKEPYELKKEILDNLKLNTDVSKKVQFYRGKGCSYCFNTGYSGRVGIAEVLMLSNQLRELILSRAQEHDLKETARKEGMRTLREEGMALAANGLTTLEEILRVTASDER